MIVRTIIALGALALLGALPVAAATSADASIPAIRSNVPAKAGAIVVARHGADDPDDHDAGDDHGGGKHRRKGHA